MTGQMSSREIRSKRFMHGLANPRPPLNAGYALVVMMIMVAVLLVSMTAALPSIYQTGQREREQEAIFCGQQYARAIYLFYRKFGRYPVSVKDLLNTDGTRFLRRPYRDPLSHDGRWRFVHAAVGGLLIDSWNQTTIRPAGAGGAAPLTSTSPASSASVGMTGTSSAAENTSETGEKGKAKHPPSTCETAQDQSSDSPYQTGTLMGAFIVGVAPCNDKQSIMVLDHQDHYDHWEFLALKYQAYSLPRSNNMGTPVQPATPGQMAPSNQPGSPTVPAGSASPGTPGTTGPAGTPGQDNGSPNG